MNHTLRIRLPSPARLGRFWGGVLETGLVLMLFALGGAGLHALARSELAATSSRPSGLAVAGAAAYPGPVDEAPSPQQAGVRIWLVDGYNVLHASLGGRDRDDWWREERRAELLARVARHEDPGGGDPAIWVVFDGPRPVPCEASQGDPLQVVFAPSADAWLIERVKAEAEPGRVAVVTADRKLAGRVAHRGARVESPRSFLGRCGSPAQGSSPPQGTG